MSVSILAEKSTHSTPRSEARGMLRVDTEQRFLPRFKNRGLAPPNVSNDFISLFWILGSLKMKQEEIDV